jgi:hypothetical protein
MSLSPYLYQVLETYEPERLQTLLAWLKADSSVSQNAFPNQEKEAFPMSAIQFNQAVTDIQAGSPTPLDDLILFSILDEFGPQFIGKSCFHWLSQSVSRHIATEHDNLS